MGQAARAEAPRDQERVANSQGAPRGASASERISGAAAAINDRIGFLLAGAEDGASGELRGAQAAFQANVSRMLAAVESGGLSSPGALGKAFALVKGMLKDDVLSAFAPTQEVAPEADASVAGVAGDDVAATADSVSTDSTAARLDASESSIEQRLAELRSSGNLTASQASLLADAHEGFQSTFDRMQYGIDSGSLSLEQIQQGFKLAMSGLSSDVQAALDRVPDGEMPSAASNASEMGQAAPGREVRIDKMQRRIEKAFARIEERLSNILDEGKSDSIASAQESFAASIDRLQNALDNGFSFGNVGKAFHTLLAELKSEVSDGLEADETSIYDSESNLDDVVGGTTSGYETLG